MCGQWPSWADGCTPFITDTFFIFMASYMFRNYATRAKCYSQENINSRVDEALNHTDSRDCLAPLLMSPHPAAPHNYILIKCDLI